MPRPKGSRNKKTIALVDTMVENVDEKLAAVLAEIEDLNAALKAKKGELKKLNKIKAEEAKLLAEKKAAEDKAAILAAVEASGKSLDEVLELLK